MMLWNYLKNEMLKHQQQTVGEDGCTMTFEEIAIYSEIFSEKIKNELGLSKNAFKRAVGRLLKENKVIITEKSIEFPHK